MCSVLFDFKELLRNHISDPFSHHAHDRFVIIQLSVFNEIYFLCSRHHQYFIFWLLLTGQLSVTCLDSYQAISVFLKHLPHSTTPKTRDTLPVLFVDFILRPTKHRRVKQPQLCCVLSKYTVRLAHCPGVVRPWSQQLPHSSTSTHGPQSDRSCHKWWPVHLRICMSALFTCGFVA